MNAEWCQTNQNTSAYIEKKNETLKYFTIVIENRRAIYFNELLAEC